MSGNAHSNDDHPEDPSNERQLAREARLRRWLNAFCPIRELGRFREPPVHGRHLRGSTSRADGATQQTSGEAGPGTTTPPEASLTLFLQRTRELLATANDEERRQRLETEVLALAAPLQRVGVFDVLQVAHPPLRRMIADHLAIRPGRRHGCST